jgi:hypothetical protein
MRFENLIRGAQFLVKAVRRGAEKQAVKRQYNLLEGQQIRLTILGSEEWSGDGRLLQVNTGTVSVQCTTGIPMGAALRIDADDVLLLGECRRCELDGSQFRAEVGLKQIIPSMSNLAKLVSAICGATPGRVVVQSNEPVHSPRGR